MHEWRGRWPSRDASELWAKAQKLQAVHMLATVEHPSTKGGRERAYSEKLSDWYTEVYES